MHLQIYVTSERDRVVLIKKFAPTSEEIMFLPLSAVTLENILREGAGDLVEQLTAPKTVQLLATKIVSDHSSDVRALYKIMNLAINEAIGCKATKLTYEHVKVALDKMESHYKSIK